ncbi:MAG TPA: phosphopantothenoylcysteine decarboxylase, partial [Pyrinomonadaceae bacterium]|nr:phosphopantothenoylcysteine decarboxylase [Pyrinomonadaceae bacterium]
RIVAGIATVAPPSGAEVIETTSAEDMRAAVLREIEDATIFIAAAAVADYRAKQSSPKKIKKSEAEMVLELERTPDILNEVALNKTTSQLMVGFAAETDDVKRNAQTKLSQKNLDMIVANDVSHEGSGFESDNNAVTILVRDNPLSIDVPLSSKSEVANRILDEVVKLRHRTTSAMTAKHSKL